LDEQVRNEHLSKYMYKMKISGYNQKFRTECLRSAKNAFQILIDKQKNEGNPLFRNRKEMQDHKANRNRSACNWWKSPSSTGKPYTFLMFVPPTPNGELAKMLKKRERELNCESEINIKFIEKGGIKVKNLLVKKDPFPTQKCGVSNCPFCNKLNPQILIDRKQKMYCT